MRFSFQNDLSHQLDEKIGEAEKFRAWKYNFSLVPEGNELDTYLSGEVSIPEGDEVKALHKKNLVRAKNIIADSIKDNLIPQVSSLKTPKEIFYSLTKLFEGKSINQKMTLRKQLKNVKIQNAETMQSYFTGVSQIREKLEAVKEEVENVEVLIGTLNGLPGSWDSFILIMCTRRK